MATLNAMEKLWPRNVYDLCKISALGTASILLVLLVVILKFALFRRKFARHLPGRKLWFVDILGNLSDIPISLVGYRGYSFNVYILQTLGGYYQLFRKEKIFVGWVSYIPFIGIANAEFVEAAISGTKMMKKSFSYKMLHPWIGTGLLTSYGSKWKSRRKLLTPSFHFDILKDFLPVFNEQSQVLANRLKVDTTKDFSDVVLPVTLCSLDIICETTLGVTIDAQLNSESQYVCSVSRISEIIMQRMLTLRYWFDFLFNFSQVGKEFNYHVKVLHDFTRKVIREKKQKLLSGESEATTTSNQKKRKAFMDLLLEHHVKTKELTEDDIREEVDTFAFEGHDTTSTGISWALYLIGLHPDVQGKIHEELDYIFGEDRERHVGNDDLKDMVYLDCVLKESQRLYPSVPMIARQVEQDTILCNYTIPKGSTINVLTYFLHRDEKYFPNPEKFDPDRFLPENSINRHPYAYIPFSAGPRNCIGQRFAQMEAKVVVSTVLRYFKLESLDPRDRLPPASELILRSPDPIRIRIRAR